MSVSFHSAGRMVMRYTPGCSMAQDATMPLNSARRRLSSRPLSASCNDLVGVFARGGLAVVALRGVMDTRRDRAAHPDRRTRWVRCWAGVGVQFQLVFKMVRACLPSLKLTRRKVSSLTVLLPAMNTATCKHHRRRRYRADGRGQGRQPRVHAASTSNAGTCRRTTRWRTRAPRFMRDLSQAVCPRRRPAEPPGRCRHQMRWWNGLLGHTDFHHSVAATVQHQAHQRR